MIHISSYKPYLVQWFTKLFTVHGSMRIISFFSLINALKYFNKNIIFCMTWVGRKTGRIYESVTFLFQRSGLGSRGRQTAWGESLKFSSGSAFFFSLLKQRCTDTTQQPEHCSTMAVTNDSSTGGGVWCRRRTILLLYERELYLLVVIDRRYHCSWKRAAEKFMQLNL